MLYRYILMVIVAGTVLMPAKAQPRMKTVGREAWLAYMDKVAQPVIKNLADDKLKVNLPLEFSAQIDNKNSRSRVAYLEAFGRTFSGIAPWLQLEGGSEKEVKLRNQYRQWMLLAIKNAVNPTSADYMEWNGGQPLVDASFLAVGLIRAPWVWQNLDKATQQQLVDAFKLTRKTIPVYSNWILFSAAIEAFFYKYGLEFDAVRMEYAVREFTQHWYVGDGLFSDGMHFNLDYYNSIVIQPYLNDILDLLVEKDKRYAREREQVKQIGQRYAQILERSINTDGSYPAFGRSIVYRGGVFHHLANIAYKKQLPASLTPAQVREGLMAVIQKTLGAPNTFNAKGWLNIGLYGTQPGLADVYITTGSLYICSEIFIPLGLPQTDEFWIADPAPWTAVKIWNGQDVPADHALDLRKF